VQKISTPKNNGHRQRRQHNEGLKRGAAATCRLLLMLRLSRDLSFGLDIEDPMWATIRIVIISPTRFNSYDVMSYFFGILDCGLQPGGAKWACAPEGFRIDGIAVLYFSYWTDRHRS